MATKTAYRWNLNGWYFKTIEVEEDPDFPGEYDLPRRSTWVKPPEDTSKQWAKITSDDETWELADLSMEDRLTEGLITQEEYDEWFKKQDDEFVSVLKKRLENDANNVATKKDIEDEANERSRMDEEISSSIAAALASIESLSSSLAQNTSQDKSDKSALENAISALQNTVQALDTAIKSKADNGHWHDRVGSADKLATARAIGNAWFDGSGNISLAQMGVSDAISSAVAGAMANAGNISVEEKHSGNEHKLIIRDTKNKLGFCFAAYRSGSWVCNYGPDVPSDFAKVYHVFGTADSEDSRVMVDEDLNSAYIYSNSNFRNASLLFVARLK